MKGKIEHRVPLSAQALTLLEKRESLRPLTSEKYVFPNTKGNPLTDNAFDDLLSEQALAHIDRDKVRAAYQRSDMLERRRELMQSWADFVMPR
jgi:integrase